MNQVIRLNDCDSEFLTRRQGKKIRERLVKAYEGLAGGDRLTIDFDRVDTMTPSFADECFGKLAERIGALHFRKTVSLVRASDLIRTLVNSVLSHRLARIDAQHT